MDFLVFRRRVEHPLIDLCNMQVAVTNFIHINDDPEEQREQSSYLTDDFSGLNGPYCIESDLSSEEDDGAHGNELHFIILHFKDCFYVASCNENQFTVSPELQDRIFYNSIIMERVISYVPLVKVSVFYISVARFYHHF